MQQDEIKKISRELEDILTHQPEPEGSEEGFLDEDYEDSTDKLDSSSIAYLEDDDFSYRKKKSSLIKPSDAYMAAFLVPVLVMVIIFVQRRIFPFGEESFLRTDMYHQYAPFFSEFHHKLKEGGSLLYSWDVGMGVNFSALYAYYLASPLNWLLILCPKSLIIEFMTYSIVIKTGLAGLAMAYYLRKHCRTQDFGIAFFAIFYALSGYMAAYSWNIMWLDCIILLPIIVLGLERLVYQKKGILYGIALGASILSNYYISIMICIFMVIYFGCLEILKGKQRIGDFFKDCFRFALYSLLAGGLSAAVLLPEIFALQATASGKFSFPKTFSSYFSIFDMLARHIGNVQTEIGLDHWPNIYCGVAVLMFLLLYLFCREIKVKEKAVYMGMLLFFFASFSMNMLNFIWHGFHYPNSLPCRQSFIYIFLVLTMCYRAYMFLKVTPVKHTAIAFWGAAAFVLMAEKLVEAEHFHFIVYYAAIVILAMYAGLIYMYQKGRSRTLVLFLALGLTAAEAAVNMTVTSVTTTSRTNYLDDNKDVEALLDNLDDDGFYRIDKVKRKTKNDGAWMNFPTVSLFSSTANADLSKFYKKLGCESSTNAYSITGATPLVDMLFSVKYALYSEQPYEAEWMRYLEVSGETWLYENLYTLPLGFGIRTDLEDSWDREIDNPAEVQNNLSYAMGVSPVLEEIHGETTGTELRFTPESSGNYYVYVTNKKVEKVTASLETEKKKFSNVDRGFLLELGYLREGIEIVLRNEEDQQVLDAKIYRFSETGLKELYNSFMDAPLVLTEWSDTRLEGTVTSQEFGLLYTSIPYDKGWTVKIDGQPVNTRKLFDTFLTFDVPSGTHTITFEYTPQGLYLGGMISAVSGALLAVLWLTGRNTTKRKSKRSKSL